MAAIAELMEAGAGLPVPDGMGWAWSGGALPDFFSSNPGTKPLRRFLLGVSGAW